MTASLQAVVGAYSALKQEGNSWRADCAECRANRLIITDALAYLMLVEQCTEDEARARLDECTTPGGDAKTVSGDAYKSFRAWCEANGEYCPSQKRFSQKLIDRGMTLARGGGLRWIKGVTLRDVAHASVQSKPVQGVDDF